MKEIQDTLNIIEALEIIEIPYRRQVIKLIETEHDVYTVNIINSEGKLIHVMKDFPHWEEADCWAMGFIDGYLLRGKS